MKKQLEALNRKLGTVRKNAHIAKSNSDRLTALLRGELSKMRADLYAATNEAEKVKKHWKELSRFTATLRDICKDEEIDGDVTPEEGTVDNMDGFFQRLWTFTPERWICFAEIGLLDLVECAMHGWTNTKIRLQCTHFIVCCFVLSGCTVSSRSRRGLLRLRDNPSYKVETGYLVRKLMFVMFIFPNKNSVWGSRMKIEIGLKTKIAKFFIIFFVL